MSGPNERDEREAEIRARLPKTAQTVDLWASADIAWLLAALDDARAERDEALDDRICSCGYGVVCGQCQRAFRARAEAAESALAAVREDLKTLAFDMHRGWKHVGDGADAAVLVDKLLAAHNPALATPTTPEETQP